MMIICHSCCSFWCC